MPTYRVIRKVGGGKRKRIVARVVVRRRRSGGAFSDYLPSLSTVANAASYIPGSSTVSKYYNRGRDIYNTGRSAYQTANKALQLYEQYKPVINPLLNSFSPPPGPSAPPPLPPGGPPSLSRSDQAHNARLRSRKIEGERHAEHNRRILENMYKSQGLPAGGPLDPLTSVGKAVELGRRYRPISFIDNGLARLGLRDKVRGFLSKNEIGQALVTGADHAIRSGFGRRKYRRGGKRYVKRKKARARSSVHMMPFAYLGARRTLTGPSAFYAY